MRRLLVVGNWKMHGSRELMGGLLGPVKAGVNKLDNVEVGICPPFVYIPDTIDRLRGSSLLVGAQDCSEHEAGAHTGDVAAEMLFEAGCKLVIVGHSERRADHGESSELVAAKYCRAMEAGLLPILCVGETLEQRDADETLQVVEAQLGAVLQKLDAAQIAKMVVAYEPVWAIGTGKTATPEQAQQVHAFIREQIGKANAEAANTARILYGGSVKPDNAAELFAQIDIDGGLIGGASLNEEDFLAICRAG